MKKVTSAVWRFFERIQENGRCVAVVCKLCENQYKYFGNTTNLRVHLINKHPIQWDLSESGNLDESAIQVPTPLFVKPERRTSARKKKFEAQDTDKNVGYYTLDNNEDTTDGAKPRIEIERVEENTDSDQEDETTTLNMVRQMHGEEHSAEEWLDEDPYHITHIETFEPKPKRKKLKYLNVKREISSPTNLSYYVSKPEKSIYQEVEKNKDEYSVFGEYVANKLRKIKAPRTRSNVQQLITTLLWQADYGMYDNAEAVKRVLMLPLAPEPDIRNSATDFVREITTDIVVEELNVSHEDTNAEQFQ